MNCKVTGTESKGGAIYFRDNVTKSVINGCNFTNCSAIGDIAFGGAIYWICDNGSVSGCSFVGCNASKGGAIYFGTNSSVNYCIFENNNARNGSAIYVAYSSVDVDFNFFGFQNNITKFPNGLVEGAHPNNWVVLEITASGDSYFVNFITNDYNTLDDNMPDYTARLSINGATKDILIKNNNYSDTFIPGNYVLTSLNSGNILENKTFRVHPDIPVIDDRDKDNNKDKDNNRDKDNGNRVNNSVKNMENCGTPLIALLIALISLPLIRRK